MLVIRGFLLVHDFYIAVDKYIDGLNDDVSTAYMPIHTMLLDVNAKTRSYMSFVRDPSNI